MKLNTILLEPFSSRIDECNEGRWRLRDIKPSTIPQSARNMLGYKLGMQVKKHVQSQKQPCYCHVHPMHKSTLQPKINYEKVLFKIF